MTNNSLAFIALSNEYCAAIENSAESGFEDFVTTMLRLLPRIYISASDLDSVDVMGDGYIDQALDEDTYNAVRVNLENVLGEHDTYLEVFEEDMKYSDTPIGASVSEGLADLYQVLFNLLSTVRDAPEPLVESALAGVKDDFRYTWSQILCNVMRPLNQMYYEQYQ